ncbi:MAG: hypothetical protein K2N05_10175 [Muribaculaceae bacterium]|nr:hypothetical protein [Muribaculaceae bacterium]
MKNIFSILTLLVAFLSFPVTAEGANRTRSAEEEPIITIKSDAYNVAGIDNAFGIMLGATETAYFDIDCGFGMQEIEVEPWTIKDGSISGTYKSITVSQEGLIRVYGDPSKIDMIQLQGGYVTEIEMEQCKNLEVLDLSHNTLKKLDLTPFTNLYAIYLSDNPFTKETPLKVGAPKNNLAILEIDIIDHLDQSFNLSDYPAIQAFDAYHNTDLWNIDPTGCPELLTMSLELTNVSTLDVSKNPKLLSLNISESRIENINLTYNTEITTLMAENRSGFINQGYHLKDIDLSTLPNLAILYLGGNKLKNLDLSHNPKLTNISLSDNLLTSLDLSNNPNLYSVTIMKNNMDFATLPAPQPTWGEYFYLQNEIPVSKSISTKSVLDLSDRVLRPGTTTTASLWMKAIDGNDIEADPSLYKYDNGCITFTGAIPDSVYVVYSNSLLADYNLYTTPFVVKRPEEMGAASEVVSFLPGTNTNNNFAAYVGIYGASPQNPGKFFVDFGDGVRKEFITTSSTTPESPNLQGTIIPGKQVTIYMPENEVMTALTINGASLQSIDLRKATELRSLHINNTDLTDIDLRYNRCLEELNLDHNQLSTLDLTGIYANWDKHVLTDLSASGNGIEEVTVPSHTQMRRLVLSDNKISSFSLKDYDNLKVLDLSDNNLTDEISLTYLGAADTINLSGNRIKRVIYDTFTNLKKFDISDNLFSIETLPYEIEAESYVYAPQKPLEILRTAPAVNLSDQNRVIDGKGTSFVWKKTDGTPLSIGTEVECEGGVTRFLNSDLGDVYCEMTNPAFPALSGADVYRTTPVKVVSVPTKIIASFTTTENSSSGEVIVASDNGTAIYIDWRGDGSEYTPYEAVKDDNYNVYDGIRTFKDAKVKVYTYDDPSDLNVLSFYNIKMSVFDGSGLTGLKSLAVNGAGLSDGDIVLPDADLQELTLGENNLSDPKLFEKYTDLRLLNLSENKFSTFDASGFKQLKSLYLGSNQITDIKFDNPYLWELTLENNLLEEIDLSGLKRLEQLWLINNKLPNIDVLPFRAYLKVLGLTNNRFTFSSLPVPSDYPKLTVYYYGNQANVEAVVSDDRMTYDLSSQAKVKGMYATTYTWFLGEPEFDSETGTLSGETLLVDDEYTIENGVTTFNTKFSEDVVCVMTNNLFPAAYLRTPGYRVGYGAGVDKVDIDEENAEVDIYTVSGLIVKRGVKRSEALQNLPSGLYIMDGKKIFVR